MTAKTLTIALILCISPVYASIDIARQKLDIRLLELDAKIQRISTNITDVSKDIDAYKTALGEISVPDEVIRTNVLSHECVVVKTVKLSPGEKKIRVLLKSFDSTELERIFCKYHPERNFAEMKSDFKEDYAEIKRSHEELLKRKMGRRAETTRRMKEIDSKLRKLRDELNNDMSLAKRQAGLTEKQLGYDPKRQQMLMDKYCGGGARYGHSFTGRHDMSGVVAAIQARISALDDGSIRDEKVAIVREEANLDVDDESEERFIQDKTRCIMQHYLNISGDFLKYLSRLVEEYRRQVVDAVEEKRKIDELVGMWDALPESTRSRMSDEVAARAVDAVMGNGFSDEVRHREERLVEEEKWRRHELEKIKIISSGTNTIKIINRRRRRR